MKTLYISRRLGLAQYRDNRFVLSGSSEPTTNRCEAPTLDNPALGEQLREAIRQNKRLSYYSIRKDLRLSQIEQLLVALNMSISIEGIPLSPLSFGDQLRQVIRDAFSLAQSQYGVGKLIYKGLSGGYHLNRFLTGKSGMTLQVIERLASALNLTFTLTPNDGKPE